MKKVQVPFYINIGTDEKPRKIPNPEYLAIRDEYTTLIQNVVSENSKDTDFIGGMPVQLEKGCVKQLLQKNEKGDYVYQMTLKVDGERFLLFLASHGTIYLINRSVQFYYFEEYSHTRLSGVKQFLFDGELVEHKNGTVEFLIFDTLFYDAQNYIETDYSRRYSVANHAVKNVLSGYFKHVCKEISVSLKTWFSINSISKVNNIYKFIQTETNKNREIKLNADGIILQPYTGVYVPFGPWNKYNNVQFKWKPSDELTIDFKIKENGPNEWHLLTKTDQPFNINQEIGNPLPATCIPTEEQKRKYHENDIAEFKYRETSNPNKNLFVAVRLRNEKEANSLSTIMSTYCVINNPFTLDMLKPAFENQINKKYLNIFSESDLIGIIFDKQNFFSKNEQNGIKKVFDAFVSQTEPVELELRLFKNGKKGKTLDKFTFYYLYDYLVKNYAFINKNTIDITENKPNSTIKFRSTYNSLNDVLNSKSISNEYKNKIIKYDFEPKYSEKKLYYNLVFKLELANELVSKKVVKLKSQFAGKMVNNLIRIKERYSFQVNSLWRFDLTKIISAYTIETLKEKNETFELECEYTGNSKITFQEFIDSLSEIFKMLIQHGGYCDTCV